MITVSISINSEPLFARSARNISKGKKKGLQEYQLDTGEIIKHKYEDGAIKLAHKLLDTIIEL